MSINAYTCIAIHLYDIVTFMIFYTGHIGIFKSTLSIKISAGQDLLLNMAL